MMADAICIMKFFCFFVLATCLCCQAGAVDLELLFRHGDPIESRGMAWKGHVKFASWIDDDLVVFASRAGVVSCISIKDGKVQWRIPSVGEISDWTVSQSTKRLAFLTDDHVACVIDCTSGEKLMSADRDQIAQLLQLHYAFPCRLAIAPDDGRLILCNFSSVYGRNGYVLAPTYDKLLFRFSIDASPRAITMSPKGDRVSFIADDEVLCVREIETDRDVFFRGNRIRKKPDSVTFAIDVPFYSHLIDDGDHTLVYTRDNSWATGQVFVLDTDKNKVVSFDACNGHIELDVSFTKRRVALTGTSTDLTILDFDGKLIAHSANVSLQRNACVEFSPREDRVLVGSWDNTLSIYAIEEKRKSP